MKKIFVLILLLTILSLNTVLAENLSIAPLPEDATSNLQLNDNSLANGSMFSQDISGQDIGGNLSLNMKLMGNLSQGLGNGTNVQNQPVSYLKFFYFVLLKPLIILIIIIVAIIFTIRFFKKRKSFEKSVVVYDGLAPIVNYIKDASSKGFSKDEIKKVLMEQGWPVEKINRAFSLA